MGNIDVKKEISENLYNKFQYLELIRSLPGETLEQFIERHCKKTMEILTKEERYVRIKYYLDMIFDLDKYQVIEIDQFKLLDVTACEMLLALPLYGINMVMNDDQARMYIQFQERLLGILETNRVVTQKIDSEIEDLKSEVRKHFPENEK